MAFPQYQKPFVHPMSKAPVGPVATGGSVQPRSPHGPKLPQPKAPKVRPVTVKSHTRSRPQAPAAKAPVNPDQALIDAAVRNRYAPQEQALNQQLQQNTRFTSGLGDWYGNAMNEIRGLQAQGQQQAQGTLGQLTSYASQPALPNGTDQQAAGARNNLNAEFATMFGRDATANSGAMDRLQAAFLSQQGNTQNQSNAQRLQLLGQKGALGQQKADYGLQYGSQLAQAEQTAAQKQQANNIAAQALGLKVDTLNKVQIPLAQSLANDRTQSQRTARSGTRIKKSAQAETKNQNAFNNQLKINQLAEKAFNDSLRAKGKPTNKASGTYTQTQLNKYDNQWNGALALAHHLKGAKTWTPKSGPNKGKPQPITRDVVYGALLKEYKNDPEFAGAAADLAFGNPLSEHDRHVLATKGVHPKAPGDLGAIVGNVLKKLSK